MSQPKFVVAGWWNNLLYAASRLLEVATFGRCRVTKYYFVAQPVPRYSLTRAESATSIKIYRVEADDPLVQQFPRPEHVIAQRFADGAICFSAVKNGALAGFIWIKKERYMEDEVRCLYVLEPHGTAAWDFDVWVAPELRLTRTFARLWDTANAWLRECGYAWSVSRISAFNPASLAAHRRLGIVYLQSGLFILLGFVQLAFFSCPPYFHLSLRPPRFPVLRLRVPPASLEPEDSARVPVSSRT